MSDAYGFIAPIYQPLSRLVFGSDLLRANRAFLDLARGKRSLIIGGGDGLAYQDCDRTFTGEYWDTSAAMAKIAKQNLGKSGTEVNCGTWPGEGEFDVVFLPFVLDALSDPQIAELVSQIRMSLNPDGLVIISDFFPPKSLSQKLLQQLMITGFRIAAKHPRRDLPDWEAIFDSKSWSLVQEKTWRKRWIRALVFSRLE